MSANGSAVPEEVTDFMGKGKGKQTEQPHGQNMSMEEDESSEESGPEEQPEEEDDEDMEEIDPDNIISGSGVRNTRGKQIDWAEAEQKSRAAGDDLDDDEDEEDDDDFEDPDEHQDEDEEMRG